MQILQKLLTLKAHEYNYVGLWWPAPCFFFKLLTCLKGNPNRINLWLEIDPPSPKNKTEKIFPISKPSKICTQENFPLEGYSLGTFILKNSLQEMAPFTLLHVKFQFLKKYHRKSSFRISPFEKSYLKSFPLNGFQYRKGIGNLTTLKCSASDFRSTLEGSNPKRDYKFTLCYLCSSSPT